MWPSLYRRSSFAPGRASVPITGAASFVTMAGLVTYGDLVTKWLAVTLWSGESHPLFGRLLGIEVVHNQLGAFSTSLGPLTREINIAATLAAVLLSMAVCARLARLDQEAPASLGLIAGAGIGNLVSMLGSPTGVPDFLALSDGRGSALVLNVAVAVVLTPVLRAVHAPAGLDATVEEDYHVDTEDAGVTTAPSEPAVVDLTVGEGVRR